MDLLREIQNKSFEGVKEHLKTFKINVKEKDNLYLVHCDDKKDKNNVNEINNIDVLKEVNNVNVLKEVNNISKVNNVDEVKEVNEVKEVKVEIDDVDSVNINNVRNQSVGVIFEKGTNRVVCYSHNKIVCYSSTVKYIKGETVVEELYDGTVIKLYYYDDKWNVATNNCIDAGNAYWTSDKSFLQLFEEASEQLDYNLLKKEFCYTFILLHPENINVLKHLEKKIIHVGTIDLKTLTNVEVDIGIEKNEEIIIEDISELLEKVDTLPYYKMGYLLKNGSDRMQLINKNFLKVKELRGNTTDFFYRCVIMYKYGKKNEFLEYYPEYKYMFETIHMKIYQLSKLIHNQYMLRYVLKINVNSEYDIVLRHLHKKYIQTKSKTTLNDVITQIKSYSPLRISNLLKAM